MAKLLATLACLPLLSRSAAACATCIANSGDAKGLLDGISWGILVLLTATMSMVAGIGWLLWKVEKSRPTEAA